MYWELFEDETAEDDSVEEEFSDEVDEPLDEVDESFEETDESFEETDELFEEVDELSEESDELSEESDEISEETLDSLENLFTHPTRPIEAVRQRRRRVLLFFIACLV